jgi:hypothetical protein
MLSSPPSVASPCVAICTLDPETSLCRGCYRTLAEIGGWFAFSVEQKLDVLRALAERRRRLDAAAAEATRAKARAARRAGRRRATSRRRSGAGTTP